jgi:hypothetical protein
MFACRFRLRSTNQAILMRLGLGITASDTTCVSDVKAQCPGVEPGEGRIRACVKTHLKDLSEPCRNVVLKAVTVKACAADVIKVCADSKPRLGRIKACMKDHLADLSAPCQEALANAFAGKE